MTTVYYRWTLSVQLILFYRLFTLWHISKKSPHSHNEATDFSYIHFIQIEILCFFFFHLIAVFYGRWQPAKARVHLLLSSATRSPIGQSIGQSVHKYSPLFGGHSFCSMRLKFAMEVKSVCVRRHVWRRVFVFVLMLHKAMRLFLAGNSHVHAPFLTVGSNS